MFWSISQWILNGTTTNHHKPWHGPLQMMTWIITNHYKSPQIYHDMNHHKSQITTNHHKPWHKPPWTMTETSTKHDMNHYKSPQTMTWTIMMTRKELCIKPYGFLVEYLNNKVGPLCPLILMVVYPIQIHMVHWHSEFVAIGLIEVFLTDFYIICRINRICRILILFILKIKTTNESILQILKIL